MPRGNKLVMVEASRHLPSWRAAVAEAAAKAMDGKPMLEGPLQLYVVFGFPRPKSHYGTGRNSKKLKPAAPGYKESTPDLDKLQRAIGDACEGIVYRNDSQIARVKDSGKRYTSGAFTSIEIREWPWT